MKPIENTMRKRTALFQLAAAGTIALACVAAAGAESDSIALPATQPAAGVSPTSAPIAAPAATDRAHAETSTPFSDDGSELMLFKDIPVVVAAGMREQTVHQAAASVTVVDANDIQLFNYRSLADVLRGQRSFYLYNNGLNTFAGVRGFQRPGDSNARILVLEDGRPTNELIYGQSHLDPNFVVPMEAVKRVEVIRGPGSSLYGTNAMFGVVNVVTKDGSDVNGIVTKIEGGTSETAHANVLYGEKFKNGVDVLADVGGFSTRGDRDIRYDGVNDPAHNEGHIRYGDDQSAVSGFAKIKYGDLTLQADSAVRRTDDSTATYLTSFFNPGNLEERRTNVTLRLDHQISETQDIHAMLYYGRFDFRLKSPYDTTQATEPFTYYSNADDDWVGQQVHYGWQMTKAFHLLVGGDATESIHTRQYDDDTIDGSVLNVPASYSAFGVFAEGEERLTPWLSVTVGGRFDQVQRVGSNVSPRVAAIFTPTKEDTIKLLYGSAFRSPTLSDLLYQTPPPSGVDANPHLKPEKIDTYEVAWERQFHSGWQTSLDGYLWKMEDAIDTGLLGDGSSQQQNLGTLWAHGLEAEIGRKWEDGTSMRFYATYSHATNDGATLTHSPTWITGASIAVPVIGKDTFLAIEPQIVGQMKNNLGQYTDPTFITNVVFTSRDFYKGWTFQAGIYNLFGNYAHLPRENADNQVETTLNYPNPEFMISFSYKF